MSETVTHNNFEVEVKPMDYNNATLDEEKLRGDMNVVFDVFENIDKILNQVPVDSEKLAISRTTTISDLDPKYENRIPGHVRNPEI